MSDNPNSQPSDPPPAMVALLAQLDEDVPSDAKPALSALAEVFSSVNLSWPRERREALADRARRFLGIDLQPRRDSMTEMEFLCSECRWTPELYYKSTDRQIYGWIERAIERRQNLAAQANTSTPPPVPEIPTPPPMAEPREGEIVVDGRHECIRLRGKNYRLTDTFRRLLRQLLQSQGQHEDKLIHLMGWSGPSHLHTTLARLRQRLEIDLKKSGWRLKIVTEERLVSWEWQQRT